MQEAGGVIGVGGRNEIGGRFGATLLGVALAALTSCGGRADAAGRGAETLVVTGSSTLAPLAAAVAERYEVQHPGARVEVQSGGSARGISDVRGGRAQVGLVSRELYAEERDLQEHIVALDGVCLIVHASNPLVGLTRAQARALWTGELERWGELGGRDAEITRVNKAAGRATLRVFADYLELEPHELRSDLVIGDNQQGIKTVAGDPDAISYVSIGAALCAIEGGTSIRLLESDGVAPTLENVARDRFPIHRALHLVTAGQLSETAADFLEYARSPAVHDLVEGLGLVPVVH